MLPGTLACQFNQSEMQINLVKLCKEAQAEFIIAEDISLDTGNQTVILGKERKISYELLSFNVGSVPKNIGENLMDNVLSIKPMQTFILRFDQIIKSLSPTKDHRKIAIIGGGIAAAEISLCIHERLRYLPQAKKDIISIYTDSDQMGKELNLKSQRTLEEIFKRQGINLFKQTKIKNFKDGNIISDTDLKFQADCIILATGASPPEVLRKLELTKDKAGFLEVDQFLRCKGHKNIFAVGDCATQALAPHPKAGVYAVRQAPILWHNLNNYQQESRLKQFIPQKTYLKLLNTGDRKALFDHKSLSFHGKWCNLLKRWIDRTFVDNF